MYPRGETLLVMMPREQKSNEFDWHLHFFRHKTKISFSGQGGKISLRSIHVENSLAGEVDFKYSDGQYLLNSERMVQMVLF
jgi:hypothetical protein